MRIKLNGYGRDKYNESSEYRKKTHEHMMTFAEERRPKFPIGSTFKIDKQHSHLHDNYELRKCKSNTRFKVVGYGMMMDNSTVEGHKWNCEHDVGDRIKWDFSKHWYWCYVVTRVNAKGQELKTKLVISNASLTEKIDHRYVSVISSQVDTEQKLAPSLKPATGERKRKQDRLNYTASDWRSITEQLGCPDLIRFSSYSSLYKVELRFTNFEINGVAFETGEVVMKREDLVKANRHDFLVKAIATELRKPFDETLKLTDQAYDSIKLFEKMKQHVN